MKRFAGLKAGRLPLLLAFVIMLSLGGTAALAGQMPAAIPTFQSPPPPPPPNDNFANATVIAGLPFSESVDDTWATTETNEPQNCYSSNNTIWYEFTPPQTMWVHVDLWGGQYESVLSVYRSYGGIGNLSNIGCSAWGPSVEFNAEGGVTYYFQAGTIYWYGPGTLHIDVYELPPPVNDNFADAKVIGSLPFSEGMSNGYASKETGEPNSCYGSIYRTIWYAYTPETSGSLMTWIDGYGVVLAVYTGSDVAHLTEVACGSFWWGGRLVFHAKAGATYYFQLGSASDEERWLNFYVEVTPPPQAGFWFSPGDPTFFESVQFYDNSWDPAQMGIETRAWDFGDGTTSSDGSPTHRYAQDGDYTVNLTVTTPDGRSASASQTVHVATHDVAIVKLVAPTAARVGQTRPILVEMKNSRHPERVEVQLFKSVPGGYQWVSTTVQNIPVRPGGRTTSVSMSYTFAQDDSRMGKVTFRAIANIQDYRDALPADNEAISAPTKVSK